MLTDDPTKRQKLYLDGKPQRDAVVKELAKHWPNHPPIFFGVTYRQTLISMRKAKEAFLYTDHAYFGRGYEHGNFRICYGDLHNRDWRARPPDRRERWKLQYKPWREKGDHIVVVDPSWSWRGVSGDDATWGELTVNNLKRHTKRKIFHLQKKGGFLDHLRGAWAVVVHSSVAGVEAVMAGVPVFCTELCPASPVGLHVKLAERIEDPWLPTEDERDRWLNSLCYANWNIKEFPLVRAALDPGSN